MLILNILKVVFRLLPRVVLLCAVKIVPKLSYGFPQGIKTINNKYLGKYTVYIDTTYPIEVAMLRGDYEPTTLYLIREFVKRGDICFDIGANVGAVTLALADRVGESGRVYAFEPGSLPFERLCRNIRANNHLSKFVYPVKLGLSDQNGVLYWRESSGVRGDNISFLGLKEGEGEPVQITTVDNFVDTNGICRIDFVKIDVEAMEYEVIQGGLNTFMNYLPIIYYETLFSTEDFRGEKILLKIENMLEEIGYRFFKVKNDIIVETRYPYLAENTVAIPKMKV